jgi:peptidoglycan/LPS O-acetylase OafA/YrhL
MSDRQVLKFKTDSGSKTQLIYCCDPALNFPMNFMRIFQISVLRKTNLNPDYAHSGLISLLRGLAAIEVASAHLRAQFFPAFGAIKDVSLWFQVFAFFTGFSHDAVVLFFLLSGWLVGGSFLNKIGEPNALKFYAIDRVTRLWIVLIPTFIITLLFAIAICGSNLGANSVELTGHAFSVSTFVGNMLGLQTMIVPAYGGNFALWSLANETWYYILFPLLLLVFTSKSAFAKLIAAISILCALGLLKFSISLYFLIWLLGVGFSRIRITANGFSQTLLFVIFCAVGAYYRIQGSVSDLNEKSFMQDLCFSIFFLLFLCSVQYPLADMTRASRKIKSIGKLLSGFSFSLYVLHIPLIVVLLFFAKGFAHQQTYSPNQLESWAIYFSTLFTVLLASYVFSIPFELQTNRLRKAIKNRLMEIDKPALEHQSGVIE